MSNKFDMPDKDEVTGKAKETFGTAQKNVGGLTGDADMQAQGAKTETEGKAEGLLGNAKDAIGDAADKVKDAFNGDKHANH